MEQRRPRSILIVEDERIIALDIRRALETLGYRVPAVASSSEEAIAACEGGGVDLALMDIRIQGARDGIETAGELSARFDVPVVYLTAHADAATIDRAKVSDAFGYIVKPFVDHELRAAIEIALCKHRMETELRRRERWYSTTLRSLGDAVLAVDPAGTVVFMNAAAENLTGWTAADAAGKPADQVVTMIDGDAGPVRVPILEALDRGEMVRSPPGAGVRARGGELRLVEDSATTIDDAGECLGAVMVLTDVTERRELERQVAMADRLASLGMVAAGVAHEINNPLSYVLVDLDLIRRQLAALESGDLAGLPEVRRLVDEVQEGSDRIRRIVADLRVFSSIARPEEGPIDPHRPLDWALRVASSHISGVARLVTQLEPVPPVMADDGRLGQVFLNLIVNAVQAIDPGHSGDNEIRVKTGVTEAGEVLIQVKDTGRGMSPDVVRRVFQPFFTTKQPGGGTGLGLAVTHGIVKSMGGRIDVKTSPGAGTAFTVVLPAADATAVMAKPTATPQPTPAAARVPRRVSILVVDDEPQVGAALTRVLEEQHEVTQVKSAPEALAMLERGERFDVVLCDMIMPGMDGRALYEAVVARDAGQASRFLFMTGALAASEVESFLESSGRPRLGKPVSGDRLLAEIDAMLR